MQKSYALAIDELLEIKLDSLPELFKTKFNEIREAQPPPFSGKNNILVVKDEKMKDHNAFYFIREEEDKLIERITERCNMSESFQRSQFTTFKIIPNIAFNDYVALAIFYENGFELDHDWKTLKQEFKQELKFCDVTIQV